MLKFEINYKNSLFSHLSKQILFVFLFIFSVNIYAQIDTSTVLTFDFNEHKIIEKNNRVKVKSEGVTLTADRFGNEKSALYIHGNVASYLNLGTSDLLKPAKGSISLWVNLDRRVYAGKGYDSNPIISTKNGPGDDFILAYCIIYDSYGKKLLTCSSKDSLKESIIVAEDTFTFGKWHHVVITQDSNFLAFYINGKLQQKARKDFYTKYYSSDSVVVGHSASKKNERFSIGEFDDIQIFHRVLSEQEVKDLYNAPNPNKLRNFFNEFLKYGIIILILGSVIIILIRRNKRNLQKQKEQYELINRITELELKVIKAQMNPHFISNCLAAIQELIYKNDIDKAGQYLAKFSYFLRQVLNYSDKNFVTLAEEIEIVKLNVELEQLRFKNDFDFQLIVDEKINSDEILIPALITQPFIENAIWHGLLPLNNSKKPKLKINILLQEDLPIIEIEDNGVGRDLTKLLNENSKGTKLAVDKIESLNRLYNTSNYKLDIIDLIDEHKKQTGTKIRIQLDITKE